MRIHVVRPGELSPGEVDSWHSMQASNPSLANPFLSPEFAIAVGEFRQGARVAVLSEESSITGFFPFERRRFGVGVPIAAGLTDCQGLIHAPGAKWDALELLRACRLSVWHFDHLVEGQRPFERYRTAIMPSPIIDLTDGFASYYRNLSSRSPQFCRNIERKARKLAREADQLRFVVDSDDTSAFHALIAWKSAQYRRTAHADIFARPWIAGLTEVLFNTRKSDFGGLLSVLYAGDVAVAAHFGLRCAHILAHWIPAYDTSLSGYSPGLIMHMRMAEFTPSAGIGVIDMGTGIHRYKEELKSGDIFVGGGTVTGDSLLAAAHRARGIASRRMITTIKRHPLPYETGKWLRKQYRLARSTHKRFSSR